MNPFVSQRKQISGANTYHGLECLVFERQGRRDVDQRALVAYSVATINDQVKPSGENKLQISTSFQNRKCLRYRVGQYAYIPVIRRREHCDALAVVLDHVPVLLDFVTPD